MYGYHKSSLNITLLKKVKELEYYKVGPTQLLCANNGHEYRVCKDRFVLVHVPYYPVGLSKAYYIFQTA